MTEVNSNSLASIIIPCYNQGAWVGEAIESALSQTYPNVEVVVVNDGSTDDSESEILKYRNKIVYIDQENQGFRLPAIMPLKLPAAV